MTESLEGALANANNPYVGPRPFRPDEYEYFYGREREARDLLSLVIAERVTLFYAQSGAGKSSLVNTRLIPGLRDAGFVVLPVSRVSGAAPTNLASVSNIYIFNLLSWLLTSEEEPARLVQLSLSDALANLTSTDGEHFYLNPMSAVADATLEATAATAAPLPVNALLEPSEPEYTTPAHVLIIDQFEELLTTHADRWPERADFFRQIDDALARDPLLWAVLVMREDFVAALDPYASLVRENLRTRYYMQRMGIEAAKKAIQQPARKHDRPFTEEALTALVNNLCQVKVMGQAQLQPGQYVEPVQLQLVCLQLWDNLRQRPPGPITPDDLQVAGDVDRALADYYEQSLNYVQERLPGVVEEAALRDWFSKRLITESGTRGLVNQGESATGGLPNAVVQLLDNERYLVRRESRAGGVWCELTHDRFVNPILAANRAWAERNQHPLTQAAQTWRTAGEPARSLYRDRQLAEAAELLTRTPDAFGEVERAFVNAGQTAEKRRKELRLRALIAGGSLAILILLGLTVWALWNAETVRSLNELIKADLLVANSLRLVDEAPQRALLLGTEGIVVLHEESGSNEELRISADTDFRDLLQQVGGTPLRAYEGAYNPRVFQRDQMIVFSPDGKWLAGANDAKIWLWEVANPATPRVLRQQKSVAGLAFSPDGSWLASAGGADNTVRLWPMEQLDQASPRILAGEKYTVTSVAFSPDGRWLAGASREGTVRLWDMTNLDQAAQVLPGIEQRLTSVVFSPHSRWLGSGAADGTVLVWPLVKLPAKPYLLRGQKGQALAVVFSQDERWLATTSGQPNTAIRLWELANLNIEPRVLDKHTDAVWSVAFSPDGRWLASGSRDKTVFLWDLTNPTAEPRVLWPGHSDYVTAVAFSPDGRWLASASWDQTVHLWDMSNRAAEPRVLRGHEFQIVSLLFSPDGRWLASGSKDQIVRLWQMTNPFAEPLVLTEQESPVKSVAFSPDRQWLASAGADGTVQLWDMAGPTATHKLIDHQTPVNALTFSPDGRWLAGAGDDTKVYLWEVSNPMTVSQVLSGHIGSVLSLAFSADGRWLATTGASKDKTVRLWEMANPVTSRYVLTENMDGVFAVAFSPDGRWLASGGRDKVVRLWEMANLTATHVLTGHQSTVTTLAFSPDSQQLASGSSDFTIRLWSMTTLTNTKILTGHVAVVWSIAFSPDGRWLASSSYDRTVRVWDMANLSMEPRVLRGHTDGVFSVAFSPDGLWLASGGADKTVRLWAANIEGLIAKACQTAGRNLTQAEWASKFPVQPYHKTCPQWPEEP